MRRILQTLLLLAWLPAFAADRIVVTLTITNPPVVGDTFTLNGSTRTWATSYGPTTIQTNTTTGNSGTNLLAHVGSYPFSGVASAQSSSNVLTFTGLPGVSMVASLATGWGTISYATNAITAARAIRVPMSVEPTATRTNMASQLAQDLEDYSPTPFDTGTALLSKYADLSTTQTFTGAKTFSSITTTGLVNRGSAISSVGSGSNSEQFGSGAAATNNGALAVGRNAVAGGNSSLAVGNSASATVGQISAAIGNSSAATGEYALAVGSGASSTAFAATSVGNSAVASGTNSLAVGNGAQATGTSSVAIGANASGSADGVAVGDGSNASAASAISLGTDSDATALSAIAIGSTAAATNSFSIAIGDSSLAGGAGSISIGNFATSKKTGVAIGDGAIADGDGAVALGDDASSQYNDAVAIGYGVTTTAASQIRIGDSGHTVYVEGLLLPGSISNTVINASSVNSGTLSNTTANGTTDISGLRLPRNTHTSLANGANSGVVFTNTFNRISAGPTGAFSIAGIAGGADGRTLILYNQTGQNMTISHDSGTEATASNRIYTMTGSDVATTGNGSVILIYDSSASRWILITSEL